RDDAIPFRDHTADTRIGMSGLQTPLGQRQGPGHRRSIELAEHAALLSASRRGVYRQERKLIPVRLPSRFRAAFGVTSSTEALNLLVKSLDILEVTVHGGKSHVRDFIELSQLLHYELADDARWHFTITEDTHLVRDTAHRFVNRLARHGPLLQGFLHPRPQLRLVVRLPHVVGLDDRGHHELSGFERGKPFSARQALPPSPYLTPLACKA